VKLCSSMSVLCMHARIGSLPIDQSSSKSHLNQMSAFHYLYTLHGVQCVVWTHALCRWTTIFESWLPPLAQFCPNKAHAKGVMNNADRSSFFSLQDPGKHHFSTKATGDWNWSLLVRLSFFKSRRVGCICTNLLFYTIPRSLCESTRDDAVRYKILWTPARPRAVQQHLSRYSTLGTPL
jgi:hypothetical protein